VRLVLAQYDSEQDLLAFDAPHRPPPWRVYHTLGTIGDEAQAASEAPGQKVIKPLTEAIKPTGGMAILRGNLAPGGCVVKLSGHSRLSHRGPAKVFEREADAFQLSDA